MHTFRRPAVMGILNVTPDSFFDGGRYLGEESLLARARQIVDEGADILDLGAASTRPGSTYPTEEEELARLLPALRLVRKELPGVLISVDTCSPAVARKAIDEGADWLNDVSGGSDEMFRVVAETGVPYVLTASGNRQASLSQPTSDRQATDRQPTGNRQATDRLNQPERCLSGEALVTDLSLYLSRRLEALYLAGACDVMVDPGFGFGKTLEENYALLASLADLRMLFPREPLLVGLSRKSMIYKPLGLTPQEALPGSLALAHEALRQGARILRVHDVRETLQVIELQNLITSKPQNL